MSRVVSNYKMLDKEKDKKIIAQIDKEHQERLKNIDYAIDLNTNNVKQNNYYAFYIVDNVNKDVLSYDDALNKDLQTIYLNKMIGFNKGLNVYNDINKIDDRDTIKNKIVQFNKFYDSEYLNGFNLRVKDLLNDDIKKEYLKQLAGAYTQVQVSDLIKLKDDDTSINELITKNNLESINSDIKGFINEVKKDINYNTNEISDIIYKSNLERFTNDINNTINDNKSYYDKIHKLYQEIDKKIIDIINRFKDKLISIDNTDVLVSKNKIKLPNRYSIDIDIMQLFNNIYPNYKFKSIDDNRHKDYDIKSKVMLDFNSNDVDNLEDLRLMNFIKNGNIQLFPIQEFLINGFISIRDEQGTDKPIPLLSNLKYINEDNKMRLPKSKNDLQLYEDYMLFFNKCKIQVKIINRQTNEVIFELLKPMSILQNTPYTKEGKYGYYIGNSVINVLKDELDELYDAPKITSHLTTKQYLKSSKPSTPPMINVKAYLYPKISTMINTYKTKKTYQNKINIEKLYDYQAFYKKHPRPNADDRDKTRDYINSYLDDLKKKGLIISYKPINKGKNITTYQIEINKNASI